MVGKREERKAKSFFSSFILKKSEKNVGEKKQKNTNKPFLFFEEDAFGKNNKNDKVYDNKTTRGDDINRQFCDERS